MNPTKTTESHRRATGKDHRNDGSGLPFALSAHPVPAKPGPMHFDNGGKTVEVYLHGDENSHYYTSPDGYMLMRGMTVSSAMPFPTGTVCALDIYSHRPNAPKRRRDLALTSFSKQAPFSIKEKEAATKGKRARRSSSRIADESYLNTFPTKGSAPVHRSTCGIPGCKVLTSRTAETIQRYAQRGGIQPLRRHRLGPQITSWQSSGGQFNPQFDVYGPVTPPTT